MKITVIGATGRVGSRIAAEALARGHQVSGIARNPDPAKAPAGVKLSKGDATKPDTIVNALKGADVVVSSARFAIVPAAPLLEAVRKAGVKRLFVVGGAGSLEVAPGQLLVDTPAFPEPAKAEAVPGTAFLKEIRAVTDLDWTFLSPGALFNPGERTGKFRVGGDQLMKDAEGKSHISMEDYAIAAVDELESPKHSRQRFSVAY
jgi:putative NADH-flavin reductase